jgi:hypothetical protein
MDPLSDVDRDRFWLQVSIQQIPADASRLIAGSVVRIIGLALIDLDNDVVADRVFDWWRGRRMRRSLIGTPIAGDDYRAVAGRDRRLAVGQVAVDVGSVPIQVRCWSSSRKKSSAKRCGTLSAPLTATRPLR